jgi:acyl dehydratase
VASHRFEWGAETPAIGTELGPLDKHLTEQQVTDFEDCSAALLDRPVMRNIHNDPEQASAVGLKRPIASGMVSVSFLNELLRNAFGDRWTRGGHLSVAFVSPLYAGEQAVARGRVTALEGNRVTLDVWTENPAGDKLAVGSADLTL